MVWVARSGYGRELSARTWPVWRRRWRGRDVKSYMWAQRSMSEDRKGQGWKQPDLVNVQLELAPTTLAVHALVKAAPVDSIHVCMGIRANGLVREAQCGLAARGLRQWVIMETVEDVGCRGVFKRLEYRRLFIQWRRRIEGVLAIGYRTPDWVIARGMPAERVFPFAYFLSRHCSDRAGSPFH